MGYNGARTVINSATSSSTTEVTKIWSWLGWEKNMAPESENDTLKNYCSTFVTFAARKKQQCSTAVKCKMLPKRQPCITKSTFKKVNLCKCFFCKNIEFIIMEVSWENILYFTIEFTCEVLSLIIGPLGNTFNRSLV